MSGARRRTFPLVPRRPLAGTPFGTVRSLRRGPGTDVAGSRAYVAGDRLASIDWYASARASAVTGGDEFIVRETYGEDSPRVVVVLDRRPSMGLYRSPFPFLSKPAAAREVAAAVIASARAARAAIGWLDVGGEGMTWLAPRNTLPAAVVDRRLGSPADGDGDSVALALSHLARHATQAPQGTFVFFLSDFLAPPSREAWRPALARGLDVVPVVIEDPVWDAGFPEVDSVVVPVAAADGSARAGIRLTRAEVAARRAANEQRASSLRSELRGLGLDPVTVDSSEPGAIDAAFAGWAARRRLLRRAHA